MRVLLSISLFILALFTDAAWAFEAGYVGSATGVESVSKFIILAGETIGMGLFVYGLVAVYKRGEQPQQYPIAHCISSIVSGTLLLIASTAYNWTANSVAGVNYTSDNSLLAVGDKLGDDLSGAVGDGFLGGFLPPESFTTLMGFIYIIGLIGFIRGLYLIKDIGKMDNQPGGGGSKALAHMLGGVACMNIIQVGCFISYMFGISMLCMGD